MFSILSRAIGFLLIIYLGYYLKQRKVFRREDGAKLSTILMGLLAGIVYATFPISLPSRQMLVLCLLAPISTLGPVYALQLGSDRSESANLNSLSIFVSMILLTVLSMCFVWGYKEREVYFDPITKIYLVYFYSFFKDEKL